MLSCLPVRGFSSCFLSIYCVLPCFVDVNHCKVGGVSKTRSASPSTRSTQPAMYHTVSFYVSSPFRFTSLPHLPPTRTIARTFITSPYLLCPRHAADARAHPFTRRGKTPAVTDTLLPTPGPRHTRIADQLAHPSTPAFIRLSHKSRRTRVGRRRRRPRRNIPHDSAPCRTAADTRTYASAR